MISAVDALYERLLVNQSAPSLASSAPTSKADEAYDKLQAITKHLARQMGIKGPIPLRLTKEPLFFSPFFPGRPDRTVKIPPVFLFDISDIPAEFHIKDENDPLLSDRTFLRKLNTFLVNYFRKKGLPLETSTLGQELRGCELLTIISALKDKKHAANSLEYLIRQQLVNIHLNIRIKKIALKAAPFIVLLLFAINLIILTTLPLPFIIVTSSVVAYAIKHMIFKPKEKELNDRALILALNGSQYRIDTLRKDIENKKHFLKLSLNKADPDVRPILTSIIDQEGNIKKDTEYNRRIVAILNLEEKRLKA